MQRFGSVPNIERAAGFAGSLLVGRIMQGSWGRWALALSLGAGFVGTLFASIPAVAPAVFGSLCVGLGLCTTPAITSALMRDRSSVATAATAFVTITTVMSLGQIAGPAIAGALADRSGAHAVLMLIAAVYGAGAVLGTIVSVLQRTRSSDDRTGHLNAARSSQLWSPHSRRQYGTPRAVASGGRNRLSTGLPYSSRRIVHARTPASWASS